MIGLRFAKLPRIYKFITFLSICLIFVLVLVLITNSAELKNSNQADLNNFPTPTVSQQPEPTVKMDLPAEDFPTKCQFDYQCTSCTDSIPESCYTGKCVNGKCIAEKANATKGVCVVGGCNGEICQDAAEEAKNSICVYRPEYECYKNAECERQTNGRCGWTQTNELTMCLDKTLIGM